MRAINLLYRLVLRFRYPASLPEDIAMALGVEVSNHMTFEEFVSQITCPACRPTRLSKHMPRHIAEEAFKGALRQELFKRNSLYSYYFSEGWLVFVLHFDQQNRLSRLYLQHNYIAQERGIEIFLKSDSLFELGFGGSPNELFSR